MGADRKYQFMESNQQRRAVGLKEKLPDIQKTLDTVKFLKTRKVIGSAVEDGLSFADSSHSLVRNRSRQLSSSTIHCSPKHISHLPRRYIYGSEYVKGELVG